MYRFRPDSGSAFEAAEVFEAVEVSGVGSAAASVAKEVAGLGLRTEPSDLAVKEAAPVRGRLAAKAFHAAAAMAVLEAVAETAAMAEFAAVVAKAAVFLVVRGRSVAKVFHEMAVMAMWEPVASLRWAPVWAGWWEFLVLVSSDAFVQAAEAGPVLKAGRGFVPAADCCLVVHGRLAEAR